MPGRRQERIPPFVRPIFTVALTLAGARAYATPATCTVSNTDVVTTLLPRFVGPIFTAARCPAQHPPGRSPRDREREGRGRLRGALDEPHADEHLQKTECELARPVVRRDVEPVAAMADRDEDVRRWIAPRALDPQSVAEG